MHWQMALGLANGPQERNLQQRRLKQNHMSDAHNPFVDALVDASTSMLIYFTKKVTKCVGVARYLFNSYERTNLSWTQESEVKTISVQLLYPVS